MKRNIRSQWKRPTILLITAAITLYAFGAYAGNIDPDSTGCKYAWAENVGWINFKPANGGVCIGTDGKFNGYAWGENVGWINFAPTGGGVQIDPYGYFIGKAWGENIGWISFNSTGAVPFGVRTSWQRLDQIAAKKIPTITEWGMIILSVLLGGSGVFLLRRTRAD